MMWSVLASVVILILSGMISAALSYKKGRPCSLAGAAGAVLALPFAAVPAVLCLADGGRSVMDLGWSMPYTSFSVMLDPLSAFFILPVSVLCAAGAVYGLKYMPAPDSKKTAFSWLWYNFLEAGMLMVCVAGNSILFLIVWEMMSLASFFLVCFDHERESARRAAWIYLVAAHLGVLFIMAALIFLGVVNGTFDLNVSPGGAASPVLASVVFALAVVGFGSKAGFAPFHIWLPEAHPAAPSHVSAVMSGAMIKMGVYGILRSLTFLGPPLEWWGWCLVAVGALSGLIGVIFALAQRDMKRLLAYSSIENVGIIAMGLGVGLLGMAYKAPAAAVLGFAGGMFHLLNHACFKGLLFLGAGAVLHEAGTVEMDKLGGLAKKMPRTAACFVTGSASIAGIPPLNGFVGEFLIYFGAFNLVFLMNVSAVTSSLLVISSLALVGGLSAACFLNAAGSVFLGLPRRASEGAGDPGGLMLWPMVVLAGGCALLSFGAPLVMVATRGVAAVFPAMRGGDFDKVFDAGTGMLVSLSTVFFFLAALFLTLLFVRRRVLSAKEDSAGTWDCGYARPTSRMQYTASAFAEPLTRFFHVVVRTRFVSSLPGRSLLFPSESAFKSETADVFERFLYAPVFAGVRFLCSKIKRLQNGRIHMYILYITLALLALLAWKMV